MKNSWMANLKKNWIWLMIAFVFLIPSLLILFLGSTANKNFDFALVIFGEIFGTLVTVYLLEQFIKENAEQKWKQARFLLYSNILNKIRLFLKKIEILLISDSPPAPPDPYGQPAGFMPSSAVEKKPGFDLSQINSIGDEKFLIYLQDLQIERFMDSLDSAIYSGKDGFEAALVDPLNELNLKFLYLEEAIIPIVLTSKKEDFSKIKALFIQFMREIFKVQRILQEDHPTDHL